MIGVMSQEYSEGQFGGNNEKPLSRGSE